MIGRRPHLFVSEGFYAKLLLEDLLGSPFEEFKVSTPDAPLFGGLPFSVVADNLLLDDWFVLPARQWLAGDGPLFAGRDFSNVAAQGDRQP